MNHSRMMGRMAGIFAVAATTLAWTSFGWAADAKDNRGVLNGPLMQGGHRASGEGDAASLELAIKDLIATYGDKYPKGPEFLKRLAEVKDPKSEPFLALKKEALLANPLLAFDKLLLVRATTGNRFARNWQTRCSTDSASRKLNQRDVDNVVKELSRNDKELAKRAGDYNRLRSKYDQLSKKARGSQAYRKAKNNAARDKILREYPELSNTKTARDAAEKALHKAAMAKPEYRKIHEAFKAGGTTANYNDALVVMSIRTGEVTTVYEPNPGKFVGDVDLHFDGDRVLFASHVDPGELTEERGVRQGKGYAVFELRIDPATGKAMGKPKRITPDMGTDVDNYDACYLPDGRIVFASTACYEGVPCVGGGSYVANLYLLNPRTGEARRLTFDQDASWHPAVMHNGRVMYTRWEYTDSAHYFSRVLMTMNPDGTDQRAFYGSNSYWPNSLFYARQVPGHPSKFVAIVAGHHSSPKDGALCLFDTSNGRHEADGAVQLITGRGKKVEPLVIDNLTRSYSPLFRHPFPLNDKYFLANVGGSVYLLDVFDNMLCLKPNDSDGSYYEPVPLQRTAKPAIQPDRVRLDSSEATVLISDIYEGPGLAGVPRGQVKGLRVYRYEYGPRHKGGHYAMGMEAGWDAKQILGTAPVEPDGSASFVVPANTPFAMQPLDAEGKALQLMRSWTVGMPGERMVCVGCHEEQDMSPPSRPAAAMNRKPSRLEPFYGPPRPYAFESELYPAIKQYCGGCHDGTHDVTPDGRDKQGRYTVANRVIGTGALRGKTFREAGIPDFSDPAKAHAALHPYVRRNGPEGDYHLLTPLEFHADTSELIQMLDKGHHNVKLSDEAMDRLITWIDLNAPRHGTWTQAGASKDILERRMELRKLYAADKFDPEKIISTFKGGGEPVMPAPLKLQVIKPAPAQVKPVGKKAPLTLDLGDGVKMTLAPIPAGAFSMGANDETAAERPVHRVEIARPFHMGATEVTLEQYRQFDPDYLNGVYDMHYKDQVKRGYYMNDMKYPVIRVSWHKAMAFCEWLSKKTGRKITLPTEAQWEWACRAGTSTPLSFGGLDADFSKLANLADATVKEMAVSGVNPRPIRNPNPTIDFELYDPRSNDGVLHLAKVGSYQPNAWGLYDMHGNVAEWTRSDYKAYPYDASDGRNAGGADAKVIRGGSWHDRPFRATSSYRLGFEPWRRVYHTGFRVVCSGE